MEIAVRGTLLAHGLYTAAAHGTGHQQGVGLAHAVAPAEGVVDVKPLLIGVVVAREILAVQVLRGDGYLAAAAHGVLHILLIHQQVTGVAQHCQQHSGHQNARGNEETGEILVLNCVDGIDDAHDYTRQGGVERNLYVVEGNLQTQGKQEQYAAPNQHVCALAAVVAQHSSPFQAEQLAGQHGCHHRHSPCLGDVAGLDDDDVIAAQAECQAAQQRYPGAHPQHHQGNIEAEQIEKQHAHVVLTAENLQRKDVFQRGKYRMLRAVGNLIARHSAEHTGAPGGVLAGGLVIVFLGLGHALVFLQVALRPGLALYAGHKVDGGNGKQGQYDSRMG